MVNHGRMNQLKQYILIIGFTFLTLAIMSCQNSISSHSSRNDKIDSESTASQKATVTELTKEKPLRQDSTNTADFNIPNGYKLLKKITGDLNGDGLDDHVLIIKATEKEKIVTNRFDEEVDRNRRGILIYLTNNDETFLATKNLNCFSSENEDGGVYFPPELTIEIENEKLSVHYGHGRYGYWKYTFRLHNSDFELIGYDSSDNYGPVVNRETSINFLTKKKLTKVNVNQSTEESGDEVFEDTWEDLEVGQLLKLSEIKDFDELDFE